MHEPVLLNQTVDLLITDLHGVYVDCTLGGGGHFRRLMSKLAPDAMLIGLDKDQDILHQTAATLQGKNFRLIASDFKYLQEVLEKENINQVDGIMIDLGVSSFQLDTPERGFSFHEDALLDMRMDRQQAFSAEDLVNDFSEKEISDILFRYGEEKYARSIARAIGKARSEKRISSTAELVEIIRMAVPAKYAREKHPARKTFQAIRIAVNKELEALEQVLPQCLNVLKPGGRLAIISFHSLEDRIIKQFFQEESKTCLCPPGYPVCVCGHQPRLKLVNRKPIIADEDEINRNPRARSAKLRVGERI